MLWHRVRLETDATLLSTLADHFPNRLVLPALRNLEFIGRTKVAFPLIRFFLAPTLRSLEVDLPMEGDVTDVSVGYFADALAPLGACCPDLEGLTISRWAWTDDYRWDAKTGVINPAEGALAAAVSAVVLSVPLRLRSLVCFTSLTPAAVARVQSMPALQTLAYHLWPSMRLSLPTECQLTELTLCFVKARDAIRAVQSIAHPGLRTLRLRVGKNMSEDEMRRLAKAVAANGALRALAVVDVGFREDLPWEDREDESPDTFRFARTLRPLLALGRLERLAVAPVVLELDDGDAEDAGRAWPALRALRLRSRWDFGYWDVEPEEACLSLRGLAALVLQCPGLSELEAVVKLSGPIPDCNDLLARAGRRENTALTALYVGTAELYDAREVAAFLFGILPNLDGPSVQTNPIVYDRSEEDVLADEERVNDVVRFYTAMKTGTEEEE
jgi:hypothetical protein